MSGIFSSLIPLFDHLYIYQSLEYNLPLYFGWAAKHPLARRLQRRRRLALTAKMRYLTALALLWMGAVSGVAWWATGQVAAAAAVLAASQQVPALFVGFSHFSYWPLDRHFKTRVVGRARQKLARLGTTVIGITGSYGKTSTKDILYVLLRDSYRVVKTPKSFNTILGVAQSVLDYLRADTDIFIAEIGAYRRGDVSELTEVLSPHIGIITAVGPQHLERFGSLENVALAKFELGEALPVDGTLFVNSGAELLKPLLSKASARIISYGASGDPYHAADIRVNQESTDFILKTPQGVCPMSVPLVGAHHVVNFTAAAAVALELGVSLHQIAARAQAILPTPHRLEIKRAGQLTIIDNTYNTNPDSAKVSLQLLRTYPGAQRILVTPGLVELGKLQAKENEQLGSAAAEVADRIIIVGQQARAPILAGLRNAGFPQDHVVTVGTLAEAMDAVRRVSEPGTVVLLENDLPDHYT